jgi:hypothetical protein
MKHQKSPALIDYQRAKQIRNLVMLSCLFLAILATLAARLAYLSTN